MTLPELGRYATGMMFIDKNHQDEVKEAFTEMATELKLDVSLN